MFLPPRSQNHEQLGTLVELGYKSATKEIESLRQRVTRLRDGLKRADDMTHSYDHVSPLIREALAATEPKEQGL